MSADLLVSALALCFVLYLYVTRRERGLSLPPGPPKRFLLGNILDFPKEFEWEEFGKWSQVYNSDVLHMSVAGKNIIILNSAAAANDLFDKRSSIYSSRPRLPMINELMGCTWDFAFAPYDNFYKKCRKLAQRELHPAAIKKYRPQETRAAHSFLRNLLRTPDDYAEHLRHMAGEFILSVTYGINVLPHGDPFITRADRVVQAIANAGVPGAYLVDAIPILKYVPDWFPGAGFKRQAKQWRGLMHEVQDAPYQEVRRGMKNGTAAPSLTAACLDNLDQKEDNAETERAIKGTMATMYTAGGDTTVSYMTSLILAMIMYPDVQKRAQKELDEVVGKEMLPDFGFEPHLPYLGALVRELLRWRPVAPMAIPHLLAEDDIYRGWRLPKGSIVIGNTWAILHDEELFPDPMAFKPERFLLRDNTLDPALKDIPDYAFGFGRRQCPGLPLAISSIWITAASMLATFDIGPARAADGTPIMPSGEYNSGLAMAPLPFKCSIRPRSAHAAEVIRSTANH